MIIRLLRDTKLMGSVAFGRGVADTELCLVCVSFTSYSVEFLEDMVVTRSLFFYEFPELRVLRGEIIALADCLFEGGKLWIMGC